jgi:hypothetical protein
VYGELPPVAVIVVLYATLTVAFGTVELVKFSEQPPAGAALTMSLVFAALPVPPTLSVAVVGTVNVPLLPQVTPETVPLLLTVTPTGRPLAVNV